MAWAAIAPAALAAMLEDGAELALVDAREEGVFACSHLLFAASLPLSRLEERAGALIPRRTVRIVVISDGAGDGLAERAAARLGELGYSDVSVLDGGIAAWSAAGYRLFSGIHVPSKAFGELVERECATPMIEATALKKMLDAGRDIAIFDSRPAHEFRRMNIPGATNCPGADLVYRLPSAVASKDTLVVVNCAGRTRSIIGAQSLINAGLANEVVALKNGTMGWHLSGFALEHGNQRPLGVPSRDGLAAAQRMAAVVRARMQLRQIDRAGLAQLQAQGAMRTVYVFDVRSPDEFATGHLPGARHAPGGQLVQATDAYIATRNARIVLVDADGVRATMTASWLVQMGWTDVGVLAAEGGAGFDERGAVGPAWPARPTGVATIAADALLRAQQAGGAVLVDLAISHVYRESHIRGARWTVRSRLAEWLRATQPWASGDAAPRPGERGASGSRTVTPPLLALTSDDGRLAEYAAHELAAQGWPARALEGGTQAWRAAGLPVEAGFDPALEPPDDMWHIPSSAQGGGESAMRQYLSWEIDLVAQIAGEPGLRFRIADAPGSRPPAAVPASQQPDGVEAER